MFHSVCLFKSEGRRTQQFKRFLKLKARGVVPNYVTACWMDKAFAELNLNRTQVKIFAASDHLELPTHKP